MNSTEITLTRFQLDRQDELSVGDKECGNSDSQHEQPPSPRSRDYSDSNFSPHDKETQLDVIDIGDEDEVWPIQYQYLSFGTDLPLPTSITPRTSDATLPPAPPDLTKFTSPFLWSDLQKGIIIWLSVVATAFTSFTAGAYSPALEQMQHEWHVSNVAILTGITTFTVGFGVAPMILAPFSEINGRVR